MHLFQKQRSPNEDSPLYDNAWVRDGACRGMREDLANDLFFSVDESDPGRDARRQLCFSCPVQSQCLTFGMDEPFGAWGGYTLEERREFKRRETWT